MLQRVLQNIHNMFISAPNPGTYTIAGGRISPLPFLKEGQRFWIVGSDLNDGVYTYHAEGIKNDDDNAAAELQDESFSGSICSLQVPNDVKQVANDAAAWEAENGTAASSPYQSENVIGVYSYTKAHGGSGAGGSVTWQDVFSSRLDPYRKVAGP